MVSGKEDRGVDGRSEREEASGGGEVDASSPITEGHEEGQRLTDNDNDDDELAKTMGTPSFLKRSLLRTDGDADVIRDVFEEEEEDKGLERSTHVVNGDLQPQHQHQSAEEDAEVFNGREHQELEREHQSHEASSSSSTTTMYSSSSASPLPSPYVASLASSPQLQQRHNHSSAATSPPLPWAAINNKVMSIPTSRSDSTLASSRSTEFNKRRSNNNSENNNETDEVFQLSHRSKLSYSSASSSSLVDELRRQEQTRLMNEWNRSYHEDDFSNWKFDQNNSSNSNYSSNYNNNSNYSNYSNDSGSSLADHCLQQQSHSSLLDDDISSNTNDHNYTLYSDDKSTSNDISNSSNNATEAKAVHIRPSTSEDRIKDELKEREATMVLSQRFSNRNEEGDIEFDVDLEMRSAEEIDNELNKGGVAIDEEEGVGKDIDHHHNDALDGAIIEYSNHDIRSFSGFFSLLFLPFRKMKGDVKIYWRHHKFRILKTICYCAVFMAVGIFIGILGPTLLALRDRVKTTTGGIGWVPTSRGIGYLIGSMLGGKGMDHFPGHWVIISGCFFLTAAIALTPFLASLPFLITITVFGGICGGLLDVCCNAMVVWVWQEKSGAWLQVLHFCFGVGGFLSPILVTHIDNALAEVEWTYWLVAIIVSPAPVGLFFLNSPKAEGGEVQGHHNFHSTPEKPTMVVEMSNLENKRSSAEETSEPSTTNDILRDPETKSELREPSVRETVIIICIFGAFLFMCTGVEINFTVYIVSFLVEENIIDDDDDVGNYLTSAFWAALTIGRLIIVPLAAYVKPQTILLIDVIGCLLFSSIQAFLPHNLGAAWAAAIGIGLFLASTSPAALSYPTSVGMSLSGSTISWILVIGNCGEMTVPLFTSILLSAIGYKSFVWINFISFVFSALFFGLLLALFRKQDDVVETPPTTSVEQSSSSSESWRGCHWMLPSYLFERCNKRHRVLHADHPPESMFVNYEDEEGKGVGIHS